MEVYPVWIKKFLQECNRSKVLSPKAESSGLIFLYTFWFIPACVFMPHPLSLSLSSTVVIKVLSILFFKASIYADSVNSNRLCVEDTEMVKAVAVLTGGKGVEGTMCFNQEEANGRFNID